MARKGWSALSPGYRSRLEKAGISKSDYERGESIKGARGHSKTPERPTQTKQFPAYQQERTRLTNKVAAMKHYFFSMAPKWNPLAAAEKFRKEPPSMVRLRQWVKLTREEWIDAIREDPTTAAYLGYH